MPDVDRKPPSPLTEAGIVRQWIDLAGQPAQAPVKHQRGFLLAPAPENSTVMNITEARKTAKFAAQVSAIAIATSELTESTLR
jgi:hypothetical protein